MSGEAGGRVFFSNVKRSLEEEDEIRLVSVGVDIGSATSHLVFSRIVLERQDSRYIVSEREVLYQSEVLLTPYCAATLSPNSPPFTWATIRSSSLSAAASKWRVTSLRDSSRPRVDSSASAPFGVPALALSGA